MLRLSYCDHFLSVVCRPPSYFFSISFVYSVGVTVLTQSSLNLLRMFAPIKLDEIRDWVTWDQHLGMSMINSVKRFVKAVLIPPLAIIMW